MTAEDFIKRMEEFCKKHNLDIAKEYENFANVYQDTYGNNIVMQMEADGYSGMPEYLESKGIVERYASILNGQEKMFEKGWRTN